MSQQMADSCKKCTVGCLATLENLKYPMNCNFIISSSSCISMEFIVLSSGLFTFLFYCLIKVKYCVRRYLVDFDGPCIVNGSQQEAVPHKPSSC